MRKKYLLILCSCILSLTMVLASVVPGMKDFQGVSKVYQVKAEDGVVISGDWEYKIYDSYDSTIEITKYNGNDTELKVPETIDGHKVASISQFAIDYEPLTTITFPKTIESIGSSGQEFRKGKNLISIKVEDSKYGDKYWTDEDGTLYSYYMKHTDQDKTEYKDYLTLIYCPKARNSKSYKIDDRVTAIDSDAFANCYNLEEVKLGNGVQKIATGAFKKCTSLTSLDFPKNVKKIGYNAFVYCDKLVSYNVDKDNDSYCDLDGVLYTKDKTKLVSYPRGKEAADQTYVVDPSCKELGPNAFSTYKLEKIILPNGLLKIGSFALDCYNLKSIEIPDTVTTLERWILGSNSTIKQLVLPASITTIEYGGALDGMWELQYLYLSGPIPTDFESKERLNSTLNDLRVLTVMIKKDYWEQYESYRNSFASDDRIRFEKWDGKTLKPIQKKKYDMSGVKFEDKTVNYDGKAHSIEISGKLPKGVEAYYTKAQTEVGRYDMWVSFKVNEEEYESIEPMHAVLVIRPVSTDQTQTSTSLGSATTVAGKKVNITRPAAVKLAGVKNLKGKKIKVSWKKNTKVNGYQIQYTTNKKFKSGIKNVTIKKNKTTSTVLKKLKKKKTYYVCIRTYKKDGKTTYYSKWSNVKKLKIKK